MIVLGADTHKRSHTIAAVRAAAGELLGEQTIAVGPRGFAAGDDYLPKLRVVAHVGQIEEPVVVSPAIRDNCSVVCAFRSSTVL